MDAGVQINLSTEPSFSLGLLMVVPSRLEVRRGDQAHAVSPRVMQVVIALARARGRTVSRDELAESCWQGRVVGEDALNRVIAKVRAIATGPGEGSFSVETVKRVGYLITEADAPVADTPDIAPAVALGSVVEPHLASQRWQLLSALAVILAIATMAWQFSSIGKPALRAQEPLVMAANDMETRALTAMFEGVPERTLVGIDYLHRATEISPRGARIWGALAMAHVLSLGDASPGSRPAIRLKVRDAAARGLALDPEEGRSIAALVSLEPTFGRWLAKDRALQKGLARARPGTAPLIFQRIQFLISVGRVSEALALVNELDVSSPLIPWIQSARINLLAANGRYDEAERAANWAGGIWPRQRQIWFARFYLATYGGRPDQALALAAAGRPDLTTEVEFAIGIAVAKALVSHNPGEADAVLAQYRKLAPTGQGFAEQAIRAATALEHPDDALAFAALLYEHRLPSGPRSLTEPRIGSQDDRERNTAILFLPPANQLWRQPGMIRISERIRLKDYWKRTRWPDLCGSRDPSSCGPIDGGRPIRPRISAPNGN